VSTAIGGIFGLTKKNRSRFHRDGGGQQQYLFRRPPVSDRAKI